MNTPGTLLALGGLQLTGYGLMTALGLLAGYIIARKQANTRHIRLGALDKVWLYALVCAYVIGRCVYVITNSGFFLEYPQAILRLWEGGISTMGALAGAVLGARLAAGKRGFRRALDTIMPGLLMALAVCRLGELTCWQGRGMIVGDNAPGFPFTIANSQGLRCLAVCIYEAAAALGAMAYSLLRRTSPAGCIGFTCLMFIGLTQVPLESMRTDDFLAMGFVKVDQLISMIMAVTITVMFLRGHLRAGRNSIYGFAALGISVIMVIMCVIEEFRIDGSANPALNYMMLGIYVLIMAISGLYLRAGWRAASEGRTASDSRTTAPAYANARRTATYYPDTRERSVQSPARTVQSARTESAPRYSTKVEAYIRSQEQSGRRKRG